MADYFFLSNIQDRDCLIHDGYVYYLNRTAESGTEYWRCARYAYEDCFGACIIRPDGTLQVTHPHPRHPQANFQRPEFPTSRRGQPNLALGTANSLEILARRVAEYQQLLRRASAGELALAGLLSTKAEAEERFIHEMCAQENYDLSLDDTKHLLRTKVTHKAGLKIPQILKMCAVQSALAFIKVLKEQEGARRLTVADLIKIHMHALCFRADAIGGFRTETVTVAGFTPTNAALVPGRMHDLLEWINEAERSRRIGPIELASAAHFYFVRIHPHTDGNGRTGRLLLALLLLRAGYPLAIIPANERLSMFAHIQNAHHGELGTFIRWLARLMMLEVDRLQEVIYH